MTPALVICLSLAGICAAALAVVGVVELVRRMLAPAAPVLVRADDDTDVLPRIRCTDLIPAAVAAEARRPFERPPAGWWLTEWRPPAAFQVPALIGDAMTVLHRTEVN